MRIAYQFKHLSKDAQKVAERENKGFLLTQFLYNKNGSRFEISTSVNLFKNK